MTTVDCLAVAPRMDSAACLRAMIEAATLAPSADNNQPWRFACRQDRLDVFHDSSRALPSDVHAMFDLTALGAAIENAVLAARQRRFSVEVNLAVGDDAGAAHASPLAASLEISEGGDPDELHSAILDRHTCRRPFSRQVVPDLMLRRLDEQLTDFPRARLDWLRTPADLKTLGRLTASTDALRFELKTFHAELYKQLRFTPVEVARTRDGLDVRTLELPVGGCGVLRLLRSWRLLKALNCWGLSRALSWPAAGLVRHSGAVGVLSVDRPDREAFIAGGRALERVWLAAHTLGLALHPLGSLPIFLAHQHATESPLTDRQRRRVGRVAERFARLVPTTAGRTVQLAFRLGFAEPPKFRSLRRPPEDVTLETIV